MKRYDKALTRSYSGVMMGINFENIFIFVVVLIMVFPLFRFYIMSTRQRQIQEYKFPSSINTKILEKYPHLTRHQAEKVIEGLREYFFISHKAGRRMVSMPSQVVDVAWHEFILFTREYERFCQKALGRFLHHTPAEAMKSPTRAQTGIKRAWRLSCMREGINPNKAIKLPLLFAIDQQLKISDGFDYSLDCRKTNAPYCAGHIGCGGGCAGGCSGSSDGCGSGCGGD